MNHQSSEDQSRLAAEKLRERILLLARQQSANATPRNEWLDQSEVMPAVHWPIEWLIEAIQQNQKN